MASGAAARVREATDLVELIGEVTDVTGAGGAAKALCPFHPDKDIPSLSIDPEKGVWHCFGGSCPYLFPAEDGSFAVGGALYVLDY